MDRELNIICQACSKPLGDDEHNPGNLWVSHAELATRRAALAEWEREHLAPAADGSGPPMVGFRTMASHPERVRWRATHEACDSPADADAYTIASRRVRTWLDVVKWTSHLMGKTWINDTNWSTVIGEAAEGRSNLIQPVG
ncbi:hypothetical protein [Kitasatospora sp. NPDC127116]|uniref:hypothetical protein n=1 Tax=Kitasatospora sp. NPDC127116 TaxID=3345367 RepID=UPI00363B9CE5